MTVRTRFAPSPTGMLHIGGVRTALFCWLYARRHGGTFILRVEDTDRERSAPEALQAILDGMKWLGLDHDEGPFYQSERMDRYKEVIDQFLHEHKAYHCYCSKEELDEMRAGQMARKEKPRYDGRCRNRTEPRPGVDPVVRFRTPHEGRVVLDRTLIGQPEQRAPVLADRIGDRSLRRLGPERHPRDPVGGVARQVLLHERRLPGPDPHHRQHPSRQAGEQPVRHGVEIVHQLALGHLRPVEQGLIEVGQLDPCAAFADLSATHATPFWWAPGPTDRQRVPVHGLRGVLVTSTVP